MAKIANDNCKKIYITDDNPRNEKPEKIRDELSKNILKFSKNRYLYRHESRRLTCASVSRTEHDGGVGMFGEVSRLCGNRLRSPLRC